MIKESNILLDKSYLFALRIVRAYEFLLKEKKNYVLAKQMLRSGTSIGANIAEANGAISKADFSAKMSIAYKECLEVKYWLSLLKDTENMDEKSYHSIFPDADEIGKLLFSIIRSTRLKPASESLITDN